MARKVSEEQGSGGLYELAQSLTNKFEERFKNIVWGEDLEYFDTLGAFLKLKEDNFTI